MLLIGKNTRTLSARAMLSASTKGIFSMPASSNTAFETSMPCVHVSLMLSRHTVIRESCMNFNLFKRAGNGLSSSLDLISSVIFCYGALILYEGLGDAEITSSPAIAPTTA
jgi:uncharacterized membrane protein (DUF2068 family)